MAEPASNPEQWICEGLERFLSGDLTWEVRFSVYGNFVMRWHGSRQALRLLLLRMTILSIPLLFVLLAQPGDHAEILKRRGVALDLAVRGKFAQEPPHNLAGASLG